MASQLVAYTGRLELPHVAVSASSTRQPQPSALSSDAAFGLSSDSPAAPTATATQSVDARGCMAIVPLGRPGRLPRLQLVDVDTDLKTQPGG